MNVTIEKIKKYSKKLKEASRMYNKELIDINEWRKKNPLSSEYESFHSEVGLLIPEDFFENLNFWIIRIGMT